MPDRLSVVGIEPATNPLVIRATPRPAPACCPACWSPAGRKHGHYERTVADLLWQSRPVHLRLRLQRFRCSNPACARRSFSESVDEIVRCHARRSQQLSNLQRTLGLALGSGPAACLAQRLAMPTSADTLLRFVRAVPLPFHPESRIVGIDEWAWRRRRSYGTMTVDLERRTVIDLLPDRDAESVAAWLRRHPGIEVVARDLAETRSVCGWADVFAQGARAGAPQARQVLDRFHLLCNLSTAQRAIVARHHAAVRAVGRALLGQVIEAARASTMARCPPTAIETRKKATHAPRRACHSELRELARAGASVSGMA